MSSSEHRFAEIQVEPEVLERFSAEMSPYYRSSSGTGDKEDHSAYHRKLMWHIHNSLSERQKQTLLLVLSGKTEREVATILGITQQVVHIYKWRAIRRLQEKLKS